MLYVPAESVDAYTAAWGAKFKDIRPIAGAGVADIEGGESFNVSVAGGVLTVESALGADVYDCAGVKVAALADGGDSVSLPAGIYIVRCGEKAVKVAL